MRFSQVETPVRRAQSVATSNPLRDPSYSAAHAATRTPEGTTYAEFAAYIEQSRALLERQRANFERERAAFAEERKLWDMERALLKSRIAELEAARMDGSDGLNGTSSKTAQFRTDFSFQGRPHSHDPSQQNGGSNNSGQNGHHVWEGSSPGSMRPTRVFPDENSFGHPPSLDAALSPQSRAVDRSTETSVPVPIEKVDSELDGITLKSTALPPNVAAKAVTPQSTSAPKSDQEPQRRMSEGRTPLKLKLSDLGAPDENLTRDAGHTPMAILGTEAEASYQSPTDDMAEEENPLTPTTTKQPLQPVESSDSYFPLDLPDDPALKGPLSLQNDAEADKSFLSELDQKLLDEAKKAVSGPSDEQDDSDDDDQHEPDPELKLKDSTNFGTAFGVPECGKV